MKKLGSVAWGRLVLVLAFSGVLVGCETVERTYLHESAPRDATFGPDQQTGAVIVGLDSDPWLFGGTVRKLEFWTYDPEVKRLVSPGQGGTILQLERGTIWRTNVVDGIQYILQLFPAGDYYLTAVTWGGGLLTSYALMADGSIAFSVRPETVTYIGNLDFKIPPLPFQAVDLVLLDRNDAAAKGLLAGYPELNREIQHQTLDLFQLDCNMKDGLETCFRVPAS